MAVVGAVGMASSSVSLYNLVRGVYFFLEDDALRATSATDIVEVPGRASSSDSLSKVTRGFLVGISSSLLDSSINISLSLCFSADQTTGLPIQMDWSEAHNPSI